MRHLAYTEKAQADFIQIANYWTEVTDDDVAAFGVLQKLDAQCRKLAELPGLLGRPREDLGEGLRTFPSGSYVIVFKYLGDDVFEVARVVNARRDMRALFGKPPSDEE
jgi:toxin ParE1/3/4